MLITCNADYWPKYADSQLCTNHTQYHQVHTMQHTAFTILMSVLQVCVFVWVGLGEG